MAESAPVRAPVQARSRRTLSRILDATRALLAEKGKEALTVQDIVARAKTSVGSFYQRFSGKEELLAYLEQGVWTRARSDWDELLAARIESASTLADRVRAVVAVIVEMSTDEGLTHWDQGTGDGEQLARHMRAGVMRTLLERREDIRHPDPEHAIALGYAAVTGATRARPEGWADEFLIEELSRLWRCYLGGEPSGGRRGGSVDYFQVWG